MIQTVKLSDKTLANGLPLLSRENFWVGTFESKLG